MGYSVSNTCGKPLASTCVEYDLSVPESSVLSDETCLNIEETTEDLYNRTESLITNTDLTLLGESCITYTEKTVKTVLLKIEEEVCNNKTEIESLKGQYLCDISLSDCELNYRSIVDSCDVQPDTLKELLQALIDEIDTLKNA